LSVHSTCRSNFESIPRDRKKQQGQKLTGSQPVCGSGKENGQQTDGIEVELTVAEMGLDQYLQSDHSGMKIPYPPA